MADINYTDYGEDENGLNNDYYNNGEDEFAFDDIDSQDAFIPIDKIDAYIQSENTYTRQLVAGGLLDALKNAKDIQERTIVLDALARLSQDEEPNVRTEIIERVPHVAEYCDSNRPIDGLSDAIPVFILPTVIRCLHDHDNQVRKTAQAALIILLENKMIDLAYIEDTVCPVLLDLFTPEKMPEEYRTEAVSLMVRISPLVSRHIVEDKFLPKFCELCTEGMFHIRKVCATNIGEMCRVVGSKLAEEYLLPRFFYLCEDGIWGVRKACTECFMDVSNSLSPTARRNDLAQLFVGLLCDQSRWVRMSAFQALGPFISTFADPDMTGLYFDQDGILCVHPTDAGCQVESPAAAEVSTSTNSGEETGHCIEVGHPAVSTPDQCQDEQSKKLGEEDKTVLDDESTAANAEEDDMDLSGEPSEGVREELISNPDISLEEVRWQCAKSTTESEITATGAMASEKTGGADDFGSFKYWRDPVPTLDLESILQEVRQSEDETPNEIGDGDGLKRDNVKDVYDKDIEDVTAQFANCVWDNAYNSYPRSEHAASDFMFGPHSSPFGGSTGSIPPGSGYTPIMHGNIHSRNLSTGSSGGDSISMLSELMAKQQDIIPPLLLENYLSMTDPSRAQTVDTDIAQHCAYSLPAVAYTLGKDNWKCLRSLYETLVTDMQWKVRRTLSYSIHELAVILGSELTHSDLIPIFNGFIKDLDEVRIGVLTHLADFLRLLNQESRKTYLPKLEEFLHSDNNRVWRPRLDLAKQLVKVCDLYDASDVVEYIAPISLTLLIDKVADVRTASLQLISRVLRKLKDPAQNDLRLMLIDDLIKKLAFSDKWHARQTYVQACQSVLLEQSIDVDQFSKEMLPSLITLSMDKTPNVRIAVSSLLSQCLLPSEYFTSSNNPHRDELQKVEGRLKSDQDRDVRYYASLAPADSIKRRDTVSI